MEMSAIKNAYYTRNELRKKENKTQKEQETLLHLESTLDELEYWCSDAMRARLHDFDEETK